MKVISILVKNKDKILKIDYILNMHKQIIWNLDELYQSVEDPDLDKDIKKADTLSESFNKKYKGKVKKLSHNELGKALKTLEEIYSIIYKASQYIHLLYAIETNNNIIKNKVSQLDENISDIENQLIFFNLELSKVPKKELTNKQNSVAVAEYKYLIKRSLETAKYNLTEKEEKLTNLKDLTGIDSFQKLYSELTNSFQYKFKVDNKLKNMNGSELRALRQNKDPKVRRDAMRLFYTKYEENEVVISHIYNNILKSYGTNIKLRGYKKPIEKKNIGNDLSNKVIDNLHDATKESYSLVERYYKVKKKLLNLKDMTLADIYAPLPESKDSFTWNQSIDIVLDGFKSFDDEFYSYAKKC